MSRHPKGVRAKILLSSVFGPYAQDDEYGSRSINPMELYHNQVTRAQGAFSLRMFHRSWGIMMIQRNISAPCTVLDFPTKEAFIKELASQPYDIVGISSIIMNIGKVQEMCRLIREHSPSSTIVVGGHVSAIPGVEQMVDADEIVKGDGIAWMREYLGEDPAAPVDHPSIVSAFNKRVMGFRIPNDTKATAATIITSVGCPLGCNFCTTSAFFGGKGKILNFYRTGSDMFDLLLRVEKELGTKSFFVMDENFLLQRRRAMDLLDRMEQEGKAWSLYVFSSANAIRKYTMDELVRLGISWIWMGLESPHASYAKLAGTDTHELTHNLRANGIKLLGSTIVGLEHHTPENIREEIEYAVAHETDFHQFMLYTPIPGTPLYSEIEAEGRMLKDVNLADIHGQHKFNFQHAAISRDDSKRFLDWAFKLDFDRNGPSVYRIARTLLEGWKRHKDHPDPRVRRRIANEVQELKTAYAAVLWGMERRLKDTNKAVAEQIHALRAEIDKEFGAVSRLAASLFGPVLAWTARREEKRLANGKTYEPPTFLERRNWGQA